MILDASKVRFDFLSTGFHKCLECGENRILAGWKFCPACGEPIKWDLSSPALGPDGVYCRIDCPDCDYGFGGLPYNQCEGWEPPHGAE